MINLAESLHFTYSNKLFTIILLNVLVSIGVKGEGTKTSSPTDQTITALLSAPDLLSGPYANAPDDNRVYFNIKDAVTENLYFGFDWRAYTVAAGDAARLTNLYYRIYRPDGTVALSATLWNPTNIAIGSGGTGVINGYSQAVNGPNIGGLNPTGYIPIVFDATVSGEHWIEFYRSNDSGSGYALGQCNGM